MDAYIYILIYIYICIYISVGENEGSNERFSANLNLYQVPLELYCRSLFSTAPPGVVLIPFSLKIYRIKIVTTCRVLYLSDPPIRTRICRACSPTGKQSVSHIFTNVLTCT